MTEEGLMAAENEQVKEGPMDAESEDVVEVGSGWRLCWSAMGDPGGPALLLIAGLGQQLNVWPETLVEGLVQRGFYVVRFDNRDIGRSARAACPPPSTLQILTRRFSATQYTLLEMAQDTLGLLDALGIERGHLVGMSMGGMIAQTVAARHPERVATLTSIMSTSGAPRVGRPALSTWLLMGKRPPRGREEAAARAVEIMRHIRSRGYPFDERAVREVALEGWDRAGGSASEGVARQLAAILKSGDRTPELAGVSAPTLVIHGDRDLMVHPTGGRATAEAIRGARLRTIPGMGHDLPAGAVWQLVEDISAHALRGGATGGPASLAAGGAAP